MGIPAIADLVLTCINFIFIIVCLCGVSGDADTILNTSWGTFSDSVSIPSVGTGKIHAAANMWGYAVYLSGTDAEGSGSEKMSQSWQTANDNLDGCAGLSDEEEYPCKMHDASAALEGLISMTFVFLVVKLILIILILIGQDGMPMKVANLVCTSLAWVFLMACWALFVAVGIKDYTLTYSGVTTLTLDLNIKPGPGLACAITMWILLMFQICLSVAIPVQSRKGDMQELNTPQLTQVVTTGGSVVEKPATTVKMEELKNMLDKGLLTQEEYDTKKAEILAKF